jgi:phosphatidylinositol 4-kinase
LIWENWLCWQIRKRDWNEQGQLLKARVSAKLSVYQAAARMKVQSLASLDVDGKTSKRLVLETLALLMDAAEACLFSVWRKLRVCEELFSSLLCGIAQIAVTRGGQPMRVLLIRLKPLVLAACAQVFVMDSFQFCLYKHATWSVMLFIPIVTG